MNADCNRNSKRFALFTPFLILTLFFGFTSDLSAQDPEAGRKVFKANCASCHKVTDEKFIGPGLAGVQDRWPSKELLYTWIKNWKDAVATGDPYAIQIQDYDASEMTAPIAVSDADIDAILAYVDAYPLPDEVAKAPVAEVATEGEEDAGTAWMWWLVLGVVFLIIAFSATSVRRHLQNADREAQGLEPIPDESYFAALGKWMWENKALVSVFVIILLVGGALDTWYTLKGIGVYEGYQPGQPIEFSHKVHAGENEINCVYCHSSAEKGRHAGIPSTNVCMNCHRGISEGTMTGKTEIAKIYEAVGFDVKEQKYTGETKPVVWNKVHNLPDHVYFNHSQHVDVGGIDCKQCHGTMEEEGVARIMPVAELNEVDGNVKLINPTLTMGWCIECHAEKQVQVVNAKNGYYEDIHKRFMKDKELLKKILDDDQVTVKELGGWECAKCHY